MKKEGYSDESSIAYFKSMSPVVCLKGILSSSDLQSDFHFEELFDDIKQEMEKFGEIVTILIPRSGNTSFPKESLGRVYIEYQDIGSSFAAYNLMNNKIFNNKPLEIIFFEQESFN